MLVNYSWIIFCSAPSSTSRTCLKRDFYLVQSMFLWCAKPFFFHFLIFFEFILITNNPTLPGKLNPTWHRWFELISISCGRPSVNTWGVFNNIKTSDTLNRINKTFLLCLIDSSQCSPRCHLPPHILLQGAVPAAWGSEDPGPGSGPAGLPDVPSGSDPGVRWPPRARPALPPHHGPLRRCRGGGHAQRGRSQWGRRGRGPVVRLCPRSRQQREADLTPRSPVGGAVQPGASCRAYRLIGREGRLTVGRWELIGWRSRRMTRIIYTRNSGIDWLFKGLSMLQSTWCEVLRLN